MSPDKNKGIKFVDLLREAHIERSNLNMSRFKSKAERIIRSKNKNKEASSKSKPKAVGRPKDESSTYAIKRIQRFKDEAISLLTQHYDARAQAWNKKLPPGTFKKLHDKILKDFPELESIGLQISYNTVKNRLYYSRTSSMPGPLSPASPIEPFLIATNGTTTDHSNYK